MESDVVVIHEWNDPRGGEHDPGAEEEATGSRRCCTIRITARTPARETSCDYRLDLFDGVLAFGEAIRRIYTDGFGVKRAWTFHEAADTEHFRPLHAGERHRPRLDRQLGRRRAHERVTGVPDRAGGGRSAKRRLWCMGSGIRAEALGMLAVGDRISRLPAEPEAPRVYAAAAGSALHVPRRQYANGLSGIPTIRVFEALACGIPCCARRGKT